MHFLCTHSDGTAACTPCFLISPEQLVLAQKLLHHNETCLWNRNINFTSDHVNMKISTENWKPWDTVQQAFSVTPRLCSNPVSDGYDDHHSSFYRSVTFSMETKKHDWDFFLSPYFRPISFHFTLWCKNSFRTSIIISPPMPLCFFKYEKKINVISEENITYIIFVICDPPPPPTCCLQMSTVTWASYWPLSRSVTAAQQVWSDS